MTVLAPVSNPENTVAQAITGRDYISHTHVSTFQSCPLRWHFEYVEHRMHEQVAASLLFGGAMHSAIEAHYRALLEGDTDLDFEDLMASFDQAWNDRKGLAVRYGKDETQQTMRELAERMLLALMDSDAAIPRGTIIGIEESLRTPVTQGLPDVLSRLDLVIQTPTELVVRDFKTARNRWNAGKLTENSPQMLIYGEMASELSHGLPVRLEFVVITKTKSPTVEVHPVQPAPIARTIRIFEGCWSAMQTGHVYPNPSPISCSVCPFTRACRNWCG